MMIIVNRYKDSITGSYNGIPFGVAYDEGKYKTMLELVDAQNKANTMEDMQAIFDAFEPLTVESYKELVETATPYILVNKSTNQFFLRWNDTISSIPVPKALVDRMIESIDKKIDILPLVKCWVRFLRNPKFTTAKASRFANYINKTYTNQEYAAKLMKDHGLSHEVAMERATTTQTPITQEGLLCTYKVSTEIDHKYVLVDGVSVRKPRYEGEIDDVTGLITYKLPEYVEDRIFQPAVWGNQHDAFYCGGKLGHIIRVGQVHYLPSWDQVNCDDNQSCVKGLHCGNLDYIRGYQNQSKDNVTHYVLIDPMDIGAITDDGSGALRVRRYFVEKSFAGVNKTIYHSSTYAAITDAEFDEMVKKAAEDSQSAEDKLSSDFNEKAGLIIR